MPTVTLKIPASAAAGDLLQAFICSFGGDSTQGAQPSGWSFVRTIQTAGATADVYQKIAAANDHGKSVSWIVTGPATAAGVMLDISGSTGEDDYKCHGQWAVNLVGTPGVDGSPPTNVSQAGELVLLLMMCAGNVTLSPPSGWTTVRQVASRQVSLLFASQNAAAAGPIAAFSIALPSQMACFAMQVSFLGASSALRAFATA